MRQIVLVGCSKLKEKKSCTAQEMYSVSTFFRLCRAYAEQMGDEWFILSAKYGLVFPEQEIAPYDETLTRMFHHARYEWAMRVFAQLKKRLTNPAEERIIILAGARYREHLVGMLERSGHHVSTPLAELGGIGKQMQFMKTIISPTEHDN